MKWNSGLLELWYKNNNANLYANNEYGSIFQGTLWIDYPIEFSDVWFVSVGECQWGTGASWGSVLNSSKSGVMVRMFDAFKRLTPDTSIKLHIVGTWK